MKRSTRTLLTLIVLEIFIIGGGFYLAENARTATPAEGYTREGNVAWIFQQTGMIAGGIGALLLVIFIMQRIRERKGGD